MGMLTAADDSDLLDPASWQKSPKPVFQSDLSTNQLGPGHNSFTVSEDGQQDIMVYHCRNYSDIKGDPLYDPNRHTLVKPFSYDDNGYPVFGKPVPYNYL